MAAKKTKKQADTLLDAVTQGDLTRLRELIKGGADVNESEEETALSKAAELGNLHMVQELLKAGADVNFGGLAVPLYRAVWSGKPEVIRTLLKAGAKVDAQEEGGDTALMTAAAAGNLEIVKMLVAAGADPKVMNEDGWTPVLFAAKWPNVVNYLKPMSRPDHVKSLVKKAHSPGVQIEEFFAAAKSGDLKQVEALLAAGVPVDSASKDEESALHLAAEVGNDKLVELLVKAGANIEKKNNYERTPLWVAAKSGKRGAAQRLIEAGAKMNSPDKLEGQTPFLACIGRRTEQREMMRLLAKHGADLRAIDQYGRSALSLACRDLGSDEHRDKQERTECKALRQIFVELGILHKDANSLAAAAAAGDLERVRKMVEAGVPPDVFDEQERTALYMAVSRQHTEIVDFLLKQGVDGLVPLMAAVRAGDITITKKLLDAGADVNRGKETITPLMTASYYGHLEVAKLLIGRGANVAKEGKTPDGSKEKVTALSIAAAGKHIELAKMLLDAGAPLKDRKPMLLVDAARRGDLKAMTQLLAEGAKPDEIDPLTKTRPLTAAAHAGQVESVAALLKVGAPVSTGREMPPLLNAMSAVESKSRGKPMPAAETANYVEVVKLLIAAGAKADVNFYGFSALSLAKQAKCKPLIELLEAAAKEQKPIAKRK